ncbi:N-inal region of Chorein a TM vesicle-mediated sorter [Leishmania donovani]|uniref:N-inal_region_of_Chorein_a_TM_vesicle-mediated_so rter_putative/Pfam:PF12624 n=1 Tax=Leishmania donovani TaxID=5661 RepID=A0A6J8F773_LEIDO|nr:N-inal region of Chorein a TM vesicle-mediated sorter [Leishmania donovani]VDZ43556.1 N-inal_region_of_Chorein_a_TM_vesicle-mediated_sorter_putative/Pfam:PF12624 [Leishmania donovani]
MLEKYIAALLVPYLSKYVENINEDKLKVNIWSGKATLNDLVLRPEALDALLNSAANESDDCSCEASGDVAASPKSKPKKPLLPIKTYRGICKNVSLSIPIKHLRSEPVVLEVGEVLVTLKGAHAGSSDASGAAPVGSSSGSAKRNVKAAKWAAVAAAKEKELDAFEAERKRQREQAEQQQTATLPTSSSDAAAQTGRGGFFSRLGELVVNNIIVKVGTVHIRYEDESTETVLGAVLGGVQLLTMNECTAQPMFTDPCGLQRMWKRLVFNDLQVYCDDPTRVRANAALGRTWFSRIDDWQQWYHRMRQRVRDGNVALSTVLGPVSGTVDAKVVFKLCVRQLLETPFADVAVKLQYLMVNLTRPQYTKLLQTAMLFTNQAEVSQLQRSRPRVPVLGHAREWWQYAICAVRTVLREPKREKLLAQVSQVCKPDYQVLYRDVVRQTEMTPEKRKAYRFVTRLMTTEDMKAGRKCVYAQIANEIQLKRKDNEIRKAEEMARQHLTSVEQQQQQQQRNPKRAWFSWLSQRSGASCTHATAAQSDTAKEIEADEKLFRSIELDYGISAADAEADHTAAADLSSVGSGSSLPPSYCWLRASFDLPLTSYRIDTEKEESITLKLFQLRGGVSSYNKPNSLLFFFRTQNITLANPTSSPAAFASTRSKAAASSSSGCDTLVPYLIEGVQVDRHACKSSPNEVRVAMRSLTDVDSGKHLSPDAPTIYDVINVDRKGRRLSSLTPAPPSGTRDSIGSGSSGSEEGKQSTQHDCATPLFSITGFLNPVEQPLPDTSVDMAVRVQLLPLRIVADPRTIEQLIRFFSPPAGVDVSGFAESTKQAASAVGSAATHEVRAAMAKTKGLYVTVDASAPVLILPKSLSADVQEPALCVSLGRVLFKARPLSETEKKRRLEAAVAIASGKSGLCSKALARVAADDEPGSLTSAAAAEEALYYYPHKASFSKFYLELTTLERAMRRPQQGFFLVPEVSIAADVLQRIDDCNTAREAVVLRLRVPSLRVASSVHQIYLVTTMMDAWLSNLRLPATASSRTGLPGDNRSGGGPGGTSMAAPSRLNMELLRRRPAASECGEAHRGDAAASTGDHSSADAAARGSSESGYGSRAVSQAPSSPPAKAGMLSSSPNKDAAARATPAGSTDLPAMRLELLVERLGLDLHDDDPSTHAVSPLPAFQVECGSAELILAVRSLHKKMVLCLTKPHIAAARDTDFPIFSGGRVRVDLLLSEGDAPTAVALSLDSVLNVCVGTPCVELLETVMDMVQLTLSAMDSSSRGVGNGVNAKTAALVAAATADRPADGGLSYLVPTTRTASSMADDGAITRDDLAPSCSRSVASRVSDLAYQIDLVQQQCSMPNRHVADVFVRIPGSITVTLLNRAPGNDKDAPFASASMRAVELRLSKYTVTMDLSGHVGEVAASVLASVGLAEANRTLLAYRPPSADTNAGGCAAGPSESPSSAKPAVVDAVSASPATSGKAGEGDTHRSSCSRPRSTKRLDTDEPDQNAHICFSFRKSRPVMPVFAEVDGKRSLVNAQELRYSSAIELHVGASTITVDLHTVMIFKTYFTAGLFSRISRLADRPVYNGRTLPPTREGPRLLMSMRVVVRDTLVVLPVDPRASDSATPAAAATTHRFCASLGSLALQNSLRATEGLEAMIVSLGEVGMWREELRASPLRSSQPRESSRPLNAPPPVSKRSPLLPAETHLEMAVHTALDLQSEDPPRIDIRSEDVSLELRETDLVQLVTLLRQNLTRADPVDIAAYALEAAEARQMVLGKSGEPVAAQGDSTSVLRGGASSAGVAARAIHRDSGAEGNRSGDLCMSMHLGRISMLLSDAWGEAASNPIDASSSRFQLQSIGVSMSVALPSNCVGVRWKSLELDDVRDNNRAALVWCEAGSLHFADSLTTHGILMRDFGVRRTALRSADAGVESMMGSVGCSDAKDSGGHNSSSSSVGALPASSTGAAARGLSRRRPVEASSGEGDSPASTQLFTMSVLSADFTLRRFAVSDQWLALSDLVCNEAVLSAWTATQKGMTASTCAFPPADYAGGKSGGGGAAPKSGTAATGSRSGMRVIVTTPSVVIPFLNSRRETLIEAHIGALLADVVQLPTVKQVAVKVRELSVVDARSGEKILCKRSSCGRPSSTRVAAGNALAPAPATQSDWGDEWEEADLPSSPLIASGGGAAAESASSAPGAWASATAEPGQAEVLQFTFKSDPVANINKIQLGIGELHALASMPIIQGLADYFASPAEPVAKIASLGVMREQRARMAAAAQQMADSSLLVLNVLWQQPRIILAGDAMQLRRRSGNLEMRLGVMRAAVRMNSSAASLSVVVKVQEYSIPSLLKRSALHFAYEANRGVEMIDLQMKRTTALFHPAEVERLVLLAQRNVLMPRDVNYYGAYEKAVAQQSGNPATPAAAPMPASAQHRSATRTPRAPQAEGKKRANVASSPPTPSRTVKVHIDGLLVAVHDPAGVNTHTLTLAALDTTVLPNGSVALTVPSLSMIDQSTGRCMLQSETVGSSAGSGAGNRTAHAAASTAAPAGSGSGGKVSTDAAANAKGDAAATPAEAALCVAFHPVDRTSDVQLGAVLVTFIPQSIGTLVNTLLSVHIPGPDEPDTAASSAAQPISAGATAPRSGKGGKSATGSTVAASAAAVVTHTSAMPFTFKAALVECRVRFCQGDREVAVLHIARIACGSKSYPNGANKLTVTLGSLFMVDSTSVNTNYRTVIYPYEDTEAGDAPGPGANPAGSAGAVMRSLVAPVDALVTYEVKTSAPPATKLTAKSAGANAAESTAPTYTRHMKCRVGSLFFVLVPDVVRTVVGVVREAQAHISDGNRDKAYTYVSDRAAESMRRRSEAEQLMEIDVIVRRPQAFMVDKPTATMGVLLSPGSLTVRSQLVLPSDTTAGKKADATASAAPSATPPQLTEPEAKLAAMPREVFAVQVRTMGMLLRGASCFQKDCNIFVQFQRALPALMDSSTAAAVAVATSTGAAKVKEGQTAKGDAGDGSDGAAVQLQSMLKVDVPMLSMMLTHEQTDFAMIVLGALLNGTEIDRTPATTTTSAPVDGRSSARNAVASSPSEEKTGGQNRGGGSAPGLHIPQPPPNLSCTTSGGAGPQTTAASGARSGSQRGSTTAGASSSAVARPPSPAAQSVPHFYTPTEGSPITSFTLIAHIGFLQAEVADLFRLRVEEARVLSTDVTTTGKMTDVQVDSIYVQHVGAEVEAPQPVDAGVPPSSQLGKGPQAGAPRTSRIQELVDVLTVTKLHMLSVQPQPVIDVDAGSSMVENTISVSAAIFNVAISPTILFDTREVLYLPFCYKVLRVPIDPIPILSLMDETTTLQEDVVLDNKHVLLTASRTRCCYVLDLNNHKLVFTDAPSGQIVLCEGCELTITNGTVHIPGMYTIGSYVSFAPSTALFTTDSVRFKKEFLNLSNTAFYRPFLSRPMGSPGGGVARRGSPGSPQSPVSARASSTAALTEISSMDTLVKSAAPRVPHSTAIELHDRTVRLLATFYCDTMEVQMLSEEVVDLSVALCMQCRIKFAQDNENEQPARRTVSVQLLNVRSGEEEEHILLPTDMVMNVSGVENVSVSVVLDSIEFCTRATLLRSLVELGKDFGAAFIEETTVSRVTPRIEYETESLDPLVPVLEAGECQHCGQRDAYLAPASNRPGILCYKCCTGHDHVPAMNFWVEVPLIDGIVFGSKSDMAHVFMRNVLLSVDPSMDLQLTLRASLYGFSNTAAVWEPLVEHFDANISGSVKAHDYTVRTDRFDYVVSPQNIRLLSGMAADYGAATALQKQLRKRFRGQKQLRTQQTAPSQGMPMYVDASFLDEAAWLQQQEGREGGFQDANTAAELSPFCPLSAAADLSAEFSGATAGMVNMSIFDALSAANRRLIGAAAARQPKRVYAHVYVTNNCNVILSVGDRRVTPRGGTLRFAASEPSVTIRREAKPDEPQYEGYATSLSNPPLYVQTKDMVLETRVVLSQEEGARHLRRTVTMVVYPLHVSRTIICFENRLSCSLASTSNNPPVRPGERFYVAPTVDLNTSILVQPVNTPDRVEYEAGKPVAEALSGRVSRGPSTMPTVQEVLCGAPLIVCCKAKTAATKSMTLVVYVRQEEMRGGVPTFVITIESRFRLRNKLPYRLIVNVIPDAGGLLAKGKMTSRPVQPLASTVLEVRQSADLGLNGYTLNQVAFMLEVRQRGRRTAVADAAALSASSLHKGQQEEAEEEEVFSTLTPVAVSPDKPFVILRSQYRRQLVIRASLVTNNCSIMFSTPYVLLNHSPIPLTLRECTRSGENRLYEAEPNYSVLNAEMNASIAACPMDIRKSEDFFVNLYHKEYRGACVPLHAQQRGVVIMQHCSAKAGDKQKLPPAASSSSKKKGTAPSAHTPGPTVIHLAYSSQVDPNGSVLVTITPRWVLVNRSHLHLYAAPSTYSGITAREAAAVTEVMVAAQQKHSKAGDGDVPPPTGAPMPQQDMDAMKHALQEMVTEDRIVFLSDAPTQVMALPPHSATPLLETPLCGPEIGYNLHILQSPLAPLYGTPIGIESIHNELIIAYKPLADTSDRAAGLDVRGASGIGDSRGPLQQRDRFLEVSITARGSYTYVVLEPPVHAPYLLLNRTGYTINVRDTAAKSKGRLMAHAIPGHGTELFLDNTVTTLIQLELLSSDGRRQLHEVSFDVGRSMTPQEMNTASASAEGVLYTLGFGGNGQQIIEITPAKAALPIAYVGVAAPPIPINVLLNMAVMTLSVVMPSMDVLFCAVTDVRFSWDRQKDREMTKFSIENFQVDNQTEVSPRYDSCLLSLRTSKSTAAASGYLERILVPAKGLICLEEVRLDVVPLALRVSDTLLVAIAGFVRAVRSGEDAPHSMQSNQSIVAGNVTTVALQEAAAAAYERCPTPATLFRKAPVQIDIWASRLTLERFIVNPIVVRVWLTRDVDEHDFFRENINSKDAALLSMMLQSCEDVTVAAPGIVTAKQTSRLGIFAQWVGKTYTDRLLAQLKGLLLQYASSLPMIGAPLKLASGFGNGAVRLFREPIEGLSTSPSAFATGLARGSAGFAQEFAGGGLGAVSNITASWSRLLSMGGGVSERERRKQNVFTGFASGIKGVVQRPMEGAAESGAAGLLKGTAQGLVGVLANPMSGLLSDMSRATGTLAKLVTDTYIPKTRRLRPIRDFHANGGVAPWRSLASVYQYQRIQGSTGTWSGDHLISSVDGPEWYPSQREKATYGKNKTPIPEDRWTLDRYNTNFMGWTYSTKYYGIYTDRLTDEVRVRRMRWTALIRPLPYSRVAFYLRVCPGMETQHRRTPSSAFARTITMPQESTIGFTSPGMLQATTVEQLQARKSRALGPRSSSHIRSSSGSKVGVTWPWERSSSKSQRANSEFFAEEEYMEKAQTIHELLRSWTAVGRNVGVKGSILRSHSGMLEDDDDKADEEMPDAGQSITGVSESPAIGAGGSASRNATAVAGRSTSASRDKQIKMSRHSRSNSELEALASPRMPNSSHQCTGDGDKRRSHSRSKRDKRAESAAAASAEESAGSMVPAPNLYVRSASGKMLPVDTVSTVAPVPGASSTPLPRTASNASAPPPSTVVEVYEYEKKVSLLGWGKRYLPSDCPAWQDVHGHEVPSRHDIRAPAGWVWTTEWTVIGGDRDGWTIVSKGERNLRRRMWQRRLLKQVASPPPHK